MKFKKLAQILNVKNFPPCYSITKEIETLPPPGITDPSEILYEKDAYQILRAQPRSAQQWYDPCIGPREVGFTAGKSGIKKPRQNGEFGSKSEMIVTKTFRNMGLFVSREEISYIGAYPQSPSKTDMSIVANVLEFDVNNPENLFTVKTKVLIPLEAWGYSDIGGQHDFYYGKHWSQLKNLQNSRKSISSVTSVVMDRLAKADFLHTTYLLKKVVKEVVGFYMLSKAGVKAIGIDNSKVNQRASYLCKLLNENLIIYDDTVPGAKPCLAKQIVDRLNLSYEKLSFKNGDQIFNEFIGNFKESLAVGKNHIEALIDRGEIDNIEIVNDLASKETALSLKLAQNVLANKDYSAESEELASVTLKLNHYRSEEQVQQMHRDIQTYTASPELNSILQQSKEELSIFPKFFTLKEYEVKPAYKSIQQLKKKVQSASSQELASVDVDSFIKSNFGEIEKIYQKVFSVIPEDARGFSEDIEGKISLMESLYNQYHHSPSLMEANSNIFSRFIMYISDKVDLKAARYDLLGIQKVLKDTSNLEHLIKQYSPKKEPVITDGNKMQSDIVIPSPTTPAPAPAIKSKHNNINLTEIGPNPSMINKSDPVSTQHTPEVPETTQIMPSIDQQEAAPMTRKRKRKLRKGLLKRFRKAKI